jgi:hypothetical protein
LSLDLPRCPAGFPDLPSDTRGVRHRSDSPNRSVSSRRPVARPHTTLVRATPVQSSRGTALLRYKKDVRHHNNLSREALGCGIRHELLVWGFCFARRPALEGSSQPLQPITCTGVPAPAAACWRWRTWARPSRPLARLKKLSRFPAGRAGGQSSAQLSPRTHRLDTIVRGKPPDLDC